MILLSELNQQTTTLQFALCIRYHSPTQIVPDLHSSKHHRFLPLLYPITTSSCRLRWGRVHPIAAFAGAFTAIGESNVVNMPVA